MRVGVLHAVARAFVCLLLGNQLCSASFNWASWWLTTFEMLSCILAAHVDRIAWSWRHLPAQFRQPGGQALAPTRAWPASDNRAMASLNSLLVPAAALVAWARLIVAMSARMASRGSRVFGTRGLGRRGRCRAFVQKLRVAISAEPLSCVGVVRFVASAIRSCSMARAPFFRLARAFCTLSPDTMALTDLRRLGVGEGTSYFGEPFG